MCYGTVKSPWNLTLRCFLCNAFECLMAFLQSELMMQDTQSFYSHKLSQVQQLVLSSQQCVASRCGSRKTKHQTSFSNEDKVFSHGKCCLFIAPQIRCLKTRLIRKHIAALCAMLSRIWNLISGKRLEEILSHTWSASFKSFLTFDCSVLPMIWTLFSVFLIF